jgi:hypothetical protein
MNQKPDKPVSNDPGNVSTKEQCPDTKSKSLKGKERPGDRGNCEKKTSSQGSE